MRRFNLLSAVVAVFIILSNSANSRAAVAPSALQAGSNAGVADSLVGDHDWKFAAKPGPFELVVALGRVAPNALPGAPFTVVLHVTPLSNSHLTFAKTPGGYVFRGTIDKPVRCRLTVVPPVSTLVREASEYTIVATGSIEFAAGADPVLGTYTGPNDYGATRFLPGGVIHTVGGEDGTWTLFDPESHIYAVTIGQTRYSLKLVPGQGLNDARSGNIVFQSVR